MRYVIGASLTAAAAVAVLVPGSMINDLGFLSMGLRGAVVFLPLTCALWFPGRIHRQYILCSVILSLLAVLIGKLLFSELDPLYLGMLVSLLCCVVGSIKKHTAGKLGNT